MCLAERQTNSYKPGSFASLRMTKRFRVLDSPLRLRRTPPPWGRIRSRRGLILPHRGRGPRSGVGGTP